MVVLLMIAALLTVGPSASSAAEVDPQAPVYRSDLLVLELSPGAASEAWASRAGVSAASARFATLGVQSLERAAAELGGVWFEPEFPADAPRPGQSASPFATFWLAYLPPGADPERARAAFGSLPEVMSATRSATCAVSAVPDDPYWSNAYYFYQPSRIDIHATEAWDMTTGDSSIVVAIIDTGVIPYHPDLGGALGDGSQIWTNVAERDGVPGVDDDGDGYVDDAHGWDFVHLANPEDTRVVNGEDWRDADDDPNDFAGHGTAVAGVVGAHSNNGIGVTGTAWRVRLMPLRVGWATSLSTLGQVDMTYVAQAVRYATLNGASVINCSFESVYQADLYYALNDALAMGVTVVNASGNKGTPNHYISDREEVLSVTSTDQNDQIPLFGNTGPFVDVAAPGVNIATTGIAPHIVGRDSLGQRQPSYAPTANGTSFSSAMASGVVALFQARRRQLGLPPAVPFETQLRLVDTADDISAVNPSVTGYGSGRINALRVLVDPPTSSVLLQHAQVAGPPVPLGVGKRCCAAVALLDSTLALVDIGASRVRQIIALPGAPVGGLAAAALGGERGFGMFVATSDGTISGFNEDGVPLPGWPVSATTGNTAGAMPALGDLDGDGGVEVVWGGSDGSIWAWHFDGSPVTGFPKTIDVPGPNLQIALSDLDGQPGVEIVAVTGPGTIHVLKGDTVEMPGWPVALEIPTQPPSLTRFTTDAEPTIVVAAYTQTYAFSPAAERRWQYYLQSFAGSEPVCGDLNADGTNEVIISRYNPTELSVLTDHGVPVPSSFGYWPRRYAVAPFGTPLMGNVSTTGDPTVLWTLPASGVYAFGADGLVKPGYPKPGRATGAAAIWDFDGDGRTEVVGGSASGPGLYVYKLRPGTWREAKQSWPTPRANFARTGSTFYDPGIGENTPVLIALVTASAEPGVVRLAWHAGGDRITAATLERRVDAGPWLAIATLVPDGAGDLRYDDTDVTAGTRLAYRLAVTVGGATARFGEIALEVPRLARLSLAGTRPNPAAGELRVVFGLATRAPARLEVLDVAGRRRASSEVGSLGPGNHVVALPAARLAPGVYVLRLVQGGEERRARCVLVR